MHEKGGTQMFSAKIVLTDRQEKWLVKHFKHTKNEVIAEKLGVSLRSVPRLARRRGLTKSKQFIRKCQTEAKEAAYASHLANGTFPKKGFIIPRSEEFHFKKGINLNDFFGEKKNQERIEHSAETRRETIRKERARIAFGLPQKTKLKLTQQSRNRVAYRLNLRKHGYIVDDDMRTVIWDDSTIRSTRLENRKQNWYKFIQS